MRKYVIGFYNYADEFIQFEYYSDYKSNSKANLEDFKGQYNLKHGKNSYRSVDQIVFRQLIESY